MIDHCVFSLAVALALLASPASTQDATAWERVGVLWNVAIPHSPQSVVDETRVAEQQDAGCNASGIRFGDTAPMRGFEAGSDWPRAVRNAVSAAAVTDDKGDAIEQLRTAAASPYLTDTQRHVVENRMILTALQFDDTAMARQLFATFGDPPGLADPLRSDRLFWKTYLAFATSSSRQWTVKKRSAP